jgi:AcrR family transcriptional regulator
VHSPGRAAGGPAGKRQRLIAAAGQLLHQQGAEKTTLADIAQAADVPVGNVYYYFKTKDDIIAAVIEAHVQRARAALASIDGGHRSPKSRLKALVSAYADQSEVIALYGCPRRDAHDLAVSLIAAYQGSALLANTFRDPDILTREARRLNRWIDTL